MKCPLHNGGKSQSTYKVINGNTGFPEYRPQGAFCHVLVVAGQGHFPAVCWAAENFMAARAVSVKFKPKRLEYTDDIPVFVPR